METREVTQYKVYTLYQLLTIKTGQAEDETRTDRKPVAHFTDKDKLDAYVADSDQPENMIGYEFGEDWHEEQPAAEGFALPLDPEPVKAEKPAEEVAQQDEEAEA